MRTRLAYYILDHRRIAKEIKELKQFYESIVENLQSAVLVMDSNNEVIFSNKQIEGICGIRPEDVIGTTPFNFEKTIPGLKIYPFVRSYNDAFEQQKPIYYENINFSTSRGPSHHISGWLIPLLDEDDNFSGMICTLRDTSDAFATFNLLVETVEHIQDAVVILQQSNPGDIPRAFFANKKFRQIFDLDETDPFTLPFQELVTLIKAKITNKKEWENFIGKAIKDNTLSTTFVFKHINGNKYFAHGKPITDRRGIQVGRMATLKKVI
jgi:PAS domain S-box-containing protein